MRKLLAISTLWIFLVPLVFPTACSDKDTLPTINEETRFVYVEAVNIDGTVDAVTRTAITQGVGLGDQLEVDFTVEEMVSISHFNVKVSKDGTNYDTRLVIFPEVGRSSYKFKVDP